MWYFDFTGKGVNLLSFPQKTIEYPQNYTTPPPGAPGGFPAHRTITIYCADHGHGIPVQLHCGDRTCEQCRNRDYWRLYRGYLEIVKQLADRPGRLRLLTLTVRNLPISSISFMRRQISDMRRFWNLLRKRRFYRNVIHGGITGVELSCKNGKDWNLHMHILFQGEYIPVCCKRMKQANCSSDIEWVERNLCRRCKKILCLRRDWLHYTRTSPVIDIRKAWGVSGGLKYVLKYLTKSPSISGFNDDYNYILKGTRLIQPFGTWYDITLAREPYPCPICGCTVWISEFQVRRASEISVDIPDPDLVPSESAPILCSDRSKVERLHENYTLFS